MPANVPAVQATLSLPLDNGLEWLHLAEKVQIGESVVIQGPVQQGLACVIAAKEAGAGSIIVTGLGADSVRLVLAPKFGAYHTIDIEQFDLLETVAELTNGHMADLVIDCASGVPAVVVSVIQLAREGGRILLCGREGKPVPEFDSDYLLRKNLTVKGMRRHSYQAVEMAMQLIASGHYSMEKCAPTCSAWITCWTR